MAKTTKRGYEEGRPIEDYKDMRNNDDDEEDEEDEYEDNDEYSNSKKGSEQVRAFGKSKDNVSLAEIERRWEVYKKDNILLRAELRAAKGSRENDKDEDACTVGVEWGRS